MLAMLDRTAIARQNSWHPQERRMCVPAPSVAGSGKVTLPQVCRFGNTRLERLVLQTGCALSSVRTDRVIRRGPIVLFKTAAVRC